MVPQFVTYVLISNVEIQFGVPARSLTLFRFCLFLASYPPSFLPPVHSLHFNICLLVCCLFCPTMYIHVLYTMFIFSRICVSSVLLNISPSHCNLCISFYLSFMSFLFSFPVFTCFNFLMRVSSVIIF